MFAKLATPDGQTVHINPDHVMAVRSASGGDSSTLMLSDGTTLYVKGADADLIAKQLAAARGS